MALGRKGFRADRVGDANQTITSGVKADLLYGNVLFDTEGAYDPLTGEFTVPASLGGEYFIFYANGGHAVWHTNTIEIQRDGVAIVESDYSRTAESHNICSGPVLLTTGEVYSVAMLTDATFNMTGQPYLSFSGHIAGGEESP